MYSGIYKGKRVLVTGSNGFKGSYLVHWLKRLGAEVIGWGHECATKPSHANLLGDAFPYGDLLDRDGRVDDIWELEKEIKGVDIVFHLAAHALVAKCFKDPRETIENNVMAATNILDMARKQETCKGVVLITTDKVYNDENWIWGYRENDKLGGVDPYSTSKICIEYIVKMFRSSYGMNIAVARAGNVIGGGDWSEKRLIPDIMRATAKGELVTVHTPHATRPWQHTLSALDGYLLLGEQILKGNDVNEAWNFGPEGEMDVLQVLETAKRVWPAIRWKVDGEPTHPHMVNLLKIDSTKARKFLGWNPPWGMEESIERTVRWYSEFYETGKLLTDNDIESYEVDNV